MIHKISQASLLSMLFLGLLYLQTDAQPLTRQHRLNANDLTNLIRAQEKSVLNSQNNNFEIKERIISAESLAAELLRLSSLVESVESESRPILTLSDCTIDGTLVLDNKRILITVHFNKVTFKNGLSLVGAVVEESLNFSNYCTFEEDVILNKAKINGIYMGFDATETYFKGSLLAEKTTFKFASFLKAVVSRNSSFDEAQFTGDVVFDGASFAELATFNQSKFSEYASFSLVSFGARVELNNAVFEKEATFDGASFNRIGGFSNIRFKGRADFGGARFNAARFDHSTFDDQVTFNHAMFRRHADFSSARFAGEVDFDACQFPSIRTPDETVSATRDLTPGLMLPETRFEKRVRLSFEQLLDGRTWPPFNNPQTMILGHPQDYRTVRVWENLVEVFKNSDDLDSQNEAEYQKNLILASLPETSRRQAALNRFLQIFWGYGVRPWRVAFWILFSLAFFTFLYWRQPGQLSRKLRWQAHWGGLKFAAVFSWHTAYRLWYGYENSRTWLFKSLTLAQSFGTKVMVFFFFKSLANISPLFSELVNKILPG